MKIHAIKPLQDDLVNVIIETPKGTQNKLAYEPELEVFKLKKVLPIGTVFPFDFGFIPNTKGGDGNPLDVLVMMDQSTYPGCLIECRILAILEANQQEKSGKVMRNDRLVAVAHRSILYSNLKTLAELNKTSQPRLKISL